MGDNTPSPTLSGAEQAVADALSGLGAVIPEVLSAIQNKGANVAQDFSVAEDLAGLFASAAAKVGGTVGTIATEVESWLPLAKTITGAI